VVLQFGLDTGQVRADGDADVAQMRCWADPGQQQQLRRSNGARGQNHLTGSNEHCAFFVHDAALSPDAPVALEKQAVNHCMRDEFDIRSWQRLP
jgi:hypothetical protein